MSESLDPTSEPAIVAGYPSETAIQDLLSLHLTLDSAGVILAAADQISSWLGYSPTAVLGTSVFDLIDLDDRALLHQAFQEVVQAPEHTVARSCTFRGQSGARFPGCVVMQSLQSITGPPLFLLTCEPPPGWQRTEQQRLITAIAERIHQSLDLPTILQTTVAEIQQLLQADRVVVFRANLQGQAVVEAEATSRKEYSILNRVMPPDWLRQFMHSYQQGCLQPIHNLQQAAAYLPPYLVTQLRQFQVQASVSVPILHGDRLLGILTTQQCTQVRQWQATELALLRQLAIHVGIAIQQAELYQQVQLLNFRLEGQMRERTEQLQQALNFESALRRITDQVRDSLNEQQILQTAVRELAIVLGLTWCNAALLDAGSERMSIRQEYSTSEPPALHHQLADQAFTELYYQLRQGYELQFCPITSSRSLPPPTVILACPILDDQDFLGALWLFKPSTVAFSDLEVRLVQQVAIQCAIALRQTRLYHMAQAQVAELERLNRLKDDFLSTVSHELRTPMSNIKLATQMLEVLLFKGSAETPIENFSDTTELLSAIQRASRYFKILQDECQREISLINDLLFLSRLDTGVTPLALAPLDLRVWVPYITKTFAERAASQQQQLQLHIPDDIPLVRTDRSDLERILLELLNNACKYTPPHEQITVTLQAIDSMIELSVSNSGIEIVPDEIPRIFDKFYRIPHHDPWKHGGTGLGLALVKKLVERLDAKLLVQSGAGLTTFTLQLSSLQGTNLP